jgi:hypothetical protein
MLLLNACLALKVVSAPKIFQINVTVVSQVTTSTIIISAANALLKDVLVTMPINAQDAYLDMEGLLKIQSSDACHARKTVSVTISTSALPASQGSQ